MKPVSTVLLDIGLALLKLVSAHRGLTCVASPTEARCINMLTSISSLDIFDEQLRKQYLAKAPEINPFGDGEDESHSFGDLDVLTKVRFPLLLYRAIN